ncbi:WYL domain-containing protein [Rhabdochromatium marinum]|uniref:WYL domain-containing protein n=1 Tax=Rhabdochromatium marinum TaxID=48729 RepID=UPI001908172B|nr:WYL domain-containing protein [Rhabdochromatium marinum]MBK1649041.1 transcriptional regulator [Rhabdochromatium marinum]
MNHDMLRRFSFIEARLLWGGGLTATELGKAFGIARQNAQHTIDQYRRQHPGQMRYDRRRRRHRLTEAFETHYIRRDVARFLDYQRAVTHTALFFDDPDWAELPFTDAETLVRPIYDEQSVRVVLEALRLESAVEIEYWAKHANSVRCISPHQLVYANERYHIRAYCHERNRYRDFVLARIVAAEMSSQVWVAATGDAEWVERMNLEFEINPDLPDSTKAALRLEFLNEEQDALRLTHVRKALVFYVNARFGRVDQRFGIPLWIPVK